MPSTSKKTTDVTNNHPCRCRHESNVEGKEKGKRRGERDDDDDDEEGEQEEEEGAWVVAAQGNEAEPMGGGLSTPRRSHFLPIRYVRTSSTSQKRKVWQVVFRVLWMTAQGRERTLRALQYTLRLYIYLATAWMSSRSQHQHQHSSPVTNPIPKQTGVGQALCVVSILSTLRKLLALSDVVEPIRSLPPLLIALLDGHSTHGPHHLNSPHHPHYDSTTKRATSSTTGSAATRHVDQQTSSNGVLHVLLRTSLEVGVGVADDIDCLGRLGFFGILRSVRMTAAHWADVMTLAYSILGLVQVDMERQRFWRLGRARRKVMVKRDEALWEASQHGASSLSWPPESSGIGKGEWMGMDDVEREEIEWSERERGRNYLRACRYELDRLWWENVRLVAEGSFAAYDVLRVKRGSEGFRAMAGFIAAAISFRAAVRASETHPTW